MSKYKFAKGYNQYGAFMGRRSWLEEADTVRKLHLQRVPLDSGGYDPGGAYWGVGEPLYIAFGEGEEEQQRKFFRAWDRSEAKEKASAVFKNAKFYR